MTTQQYNQYLNKYNANWEEPCSSFFKHRGVHMSSVLTTWCALGLKTNGYHKDNAYIVDMLDKDGNVVGHYKSVPGGTHWELPDLIMQLNKYESDNGFRRIIK